MLEMQRPPEVTTDHLGGLSLLELRTIIVEVLNGGVNRLVKRALLRTRSASTRFRFSVNASLIACLSPTSLAFLTRSDGYALACSGTGQRRSMLHGVRHVPGRLTTACLAVLP